MESPSRTMCFMAWRISTDFAFGTTKKPETHPALLHTSNREQLV
jgi:hypothetical protein